MSIQWLQRFVIDEGHGVKIRVGHIMIFAAEKMFCRHFLTEGLESLNDHKNLCFTIRITESEWDESQLAATKKKKQEGEAEAKEEEGDGNGKKGSDESPSQNNETDENQEEAHDPVADLKIEIPPTTLQLLSGILEYAAKGHCVYPGDTTRLDPERGAGLFGRKDFRAIMYAPCPYFDIPDDVLHGIPITWREYQILERFGPVRAMAALGSMFRWFPTAPWIDINRKSFLGDTEEEHVAFIESAILHKMKIQLQHGPKRPGTYCYLEATNENLAATEDVNNSEFGVTDKTIQREAVGRQRCTIYYNDNFVDWIKSSQDAILQGGNNGLGVQTSIDPEATRIMVYRPGSPSLQAIAHPNAPTHTLTMLGNYVYFATPGPGQTPEQVGHVGARLVDDGFLVFCNFPLAKLLSKITSKETITIEQADLLPKGPAGAAMLEMEMVYNPRKGGVTSKPGTEVQQQEVSQIEKEAAVAGGEVEEEEDSRIVPLEIQLGTPDEECVRALALVGQDVGMSGMADAVKQLQVTMSQVMDNLLTCRNKASSAEAKEQGATTVGASHDDALAGEDCAGGEELTAEQLQREMELLNGSTVLIMVELQADTSPTLGLAWSMSREEGERRKKAQSEETPIYLDLLAGRLREEKEEKSGCLKVLPRVASELKFRCAFGVNL